MRPGGGGLDQPTLPRLDVHGIGDGAPGGAGLRQRLDQRGVRALADPDRLLIRGGSAGGYTTLCALTFRDTFAAGASFYGVADLEVLARDTHKFEARYLDGLVGVWPDDEATYRERSPIHHTDRISTPMIVLQGADDPVVPPNQAEAIVAALDDRGVTHAYLLFEGESHGFRRADTIERAAAAEYAFYCAALDIEPPPGTAPVELVHGD